MTRFQLMKGDSVENKDELKYPLYASPKIDGIRACVKDGVVLCFSLKPVPNEYIQEMLGKPEYEGLDGEITIGLATHEDCYRNSESGVMSRDGQPEFTFHVFDKFDCDEPYSFRMDRAYEQVTHHFDNEYDKVRIVHQEVMNSPCELKIFEESVLNDGYEGVMVRSIGGIYKFGRSTVKQGYLLKIKRFVDGEAEIISVEEKMTNNNPKKINERGLSERSTKKEGKVPAGTMGKLVVKDIDTGVEFKVGTGFTDIERQEFWDNRCNETGNLIKYKHFPKGVKDKPRHPVYLGRRNKLDL